MLINGESVQFEPFGRQFIDLCNEKPSSESKRSAVQVDEDGDRPREIYRIRGGDGNNVYEEIYAYGNKAVWSCNNTTLLKTFSTDFIITDAFWHTFTTSSSDNLCRSRGPWLGLCLIGKNNIDVYRVSDGELFRGISPFPLQRVVSTDFGLLLVRDPTPSERRSSKTSDDQHFPFLFSISHPLNEIVPVIYMPKDSAGNGITRYTTNLTLKVVYSDLRLGLLLMFDEKTGYHSLWKIRKASKQDAAAASEYLQHSFLSNATSSTAQSSLYFNKLTPSLGQSGPVMFAYSPSFGQSRGGPSSFSDQHTGSQQQTTATTSLSSGLLTHLFAGAPSSTPEQLFRPPFPVDNRSPASFARLFPSPTLAMTPRHPMGRSPALAMSSTITRLMRLNTSGGDTTPGSLALTPRSIAGTTPRTDVYRNYFPSPALNSYHGGDCGRKNNLPPSVPIVPDLCLEPFWNEDSALARHDLQTLPKSPAPSVRTVVVEDFAGGIYFCYLISSMRQLRCLQISQKTNNMDVCGPCSVSVISCRDVAVMSDSKFMIILDQHYSLCLYNGIKKVSTLYCDAFSLLSPPDKYTSELNKSHASRILSSSEVVSLTDDNQLATTCQAMDVALSPVVDDTGTAASTSTSMMGGTVLSVGTFCEKSPYFLVTLKSNRVCRCSIPPLDTDPVVTLCLSALKIVLPPDTSVELYSSWCLNRQLLLSNSGSPDCPEIILFMKLIMEATGFPSLKMFHEFGLEDDPMCELTAKRSKCSHGGSDSDWQYLRSNLMNSIEGEKAFLRNEVTKPSDSDEAVKEIFVQSAASWFNHLPTIFYALHCCYEEMKLNQMHWPRLKPFGYCLCVMAKALRLHSYIDHYYRDGCILSQCDQSVVIDAAADFRHLHFPSYWSAESLNIFHHIFEIIKGGADNRRMITIGCCERTWIVCVLYRLVRGDVVRSSDLDAYINTVGDRSNFQRSIISILDSTKETEDVSDTLARLLRCIEDNGDFRNHVGTLWTLPAGIIAPLLLRLTPPQLASIQPSMTADVVTTSILWTPLEQVSCHEKVATKLKTGDTDGMAGSILNDELSKMLFPADLRLVDARNMLRSSKHTKIPLKQKPGTADNEFREEQERYLYSVCVRTMALPLGRGMFTLRSHRPILAENIEIPKLCLTGRTSGPQALTIDLSHIDVPSNMDLWAKFHNGVAAGLRLAPPDLISGNSSGTSGQQLDTSWIIYNMPRSSNPLVGSDNPGSLNPEHSGFLFGLGLNGHLSNLALFNLHEYLIKGDPMTSSALLLGISSAKRKSAELQPMKMLSTHLPFLLSPTLLELNIDPMVQTAAVLGVGLLYAESGNYRLAEALVREIGRPATASTDNFADRESYALSCGLSLGLITLGFGDMIFGDPDFTLADELRLLMNGGRKKKFHYATDSPPSQLVKDGDYLNVHVTSAPAIIALGLMYLKRNNRQVASWLEPPETSALLDTLRPDILMLRIVSKCLILWDDIVPSVDWIETHVPSYVARIVTMDDEERTLEIKLQRIDLETIAQAYCNIVAGACMAVGFKFAGSANSEAFKCLIHYYKLFDGSLQDRSPSWWHKIYAKAGRYTTETALNMVLLAIGAVMAGTGNLDVLRIVRHLRRRVGCSGTNCNNWLLHGGHMATHMALGLLFLGGGRYTLSTSNFSVAMLLCAFYPKFPISPNDNRFHLQAFRHLYVLACVPRLLTTVDHLTSEIAYSSVSVKYKPCRHYDSTVETLRTPCMLPELKLLEEIRIDDERYWPIRFTASDNWKELKSFLKSQKPLELWRRAGFYTWKEDPLGYKSGALLQRIHPEYWVPTVQPFPFSEAAEILASLKVWCQRSDCEDVYSSLVDLYQLAGRNDPRTIGIWQLKLLLVSETSLAALSTGTSIAERMEFLLALEMKLRNELGEGISADSLKAYVEKNSDVALEALWPQAGAKFGQFLTFFDLPERSFWVETGLREYRNLRSFLEKFSSLNMPAKTALTVYTILMKS